MLQLEFRLRSKRDTRLVWNTSEDEMQALEAATTARVGAYCALTGAACAVTGASLLMVSGADLDVVLATDGMTEYLALAGARSGILTANLVAWIVMVFLMGIAGVSMAAMSTERPVAARVARYCYLTGVPLVMAAYVAWLAIIVTIAPDTSPVAVSLATVVGWFASRADWIATILIIGIGPTILSYAGHGVWSPSWLLRWSIGRV